MKHLLLFLSFFLSQFCFAQDKIITKNGDVILAYQVDIGGSSIYYKLQNHDKANLKSINKSDVLMIKKQNGTVLNLYTDNTVTTVNRQQTISVSSNPLQESISELSKKQNKELIDNINNYDPKYIGEPNKKAKNLFCILGIGHESQLVNDDIEISQEMGCYEFRDDVKGKDLAKSLSKHSANERGDLKYEKLKYNCNNPALLIRVKNKTDKIIYLDLGNSFFSRNGEATPYYIPSSSSSSSVSERGGNVNMGSVAGVLGIGGIVGELAGGLSVGGSSGTSTSNTIYSQRVISIPPKSVVAIDPQLLFIKLGNICEGVHTKEIWKIWGYSPVISFDKEEKFNTGDTIKYTEENSPLNFTVYISYSFNNDLSESHKLFGLYYLRKLIGYKSNNTNDGGLKDLEKCLPGYNKALGFGAIIEYKEGDPLPKP